VGTVSSGPEILGKSKGEGPKEVLWKEVKQRGYSRTRGENLPGKFLDLSSPRCREREEKMWKNGGKHKVYERGVRVPKKVPREKKSAEHSGEHRVLGP